MIRTHGNLKANTFSYSFPRNNHPPPLERGRDLWIIRLKLLGPRLATVGYRNEK